MTHSGGQRHAVGYANQQFEVSVFDEEANARRVVGWTNDSAAAAKLKDSAELRPGWRFGWVTDLFTDISHTEVGPWIGERPMPDAAAMLAAAPAGEGVGS